MQGRLDKVREDRVLARRDRGFDRICVSVEV